jgi:hypothetical protein
MEKVTPNFFGYFRNFQNTARRKQSPNRRKFAQSGHPDFNLEKTSLKNGC